MLTYLGSGERSYGEHPIKAYERPYWEFQAVISGRISMVANSGEEPACRRTLWIFPAHFCHGWSGPSRETAEVVVFHFLSVPETVRRLTEETRYLRIALSPEQCRRLRKLSEQAQRYWHQPALGMTVCYEHVLLELSLLALESIPELPSGKQVDRQRVDQALAWFSRHFAENPGQKEVARAVGVSPAHLRRLFHEVLQSSPKQTLDQLRFQRAIQLMSEPGVKLETVGEACGFSSASSFSRAFKNKFGCSPDAWRG